MDRIRRWIGLSSAVFFLFMASDLTFAQTNSPEEEFRQLIKVDSNIQPLGATPFGENIDLYTGTLSFEQTDVSLKGNGPTITLSRSLDTANDLDTGVIGAIRPFGDWDLNIPRIETIMADTAGNWSVEGSNPSSRCTYFGPPPSVYPTQGHDLFGATQYWYGYHLIIPGSGSQDLMLRGSNTDSTSPTMNGQSFPIITKQNWMVHCGVTADDGGEGFVALAPDGTQYTFSHYASRPTAYITSPYGTSAQAVTTVASNVVSPQELGSNLLARHVAQLLVTQVKDRFGNTLTYSYDSQSRLSGISANDGRSLSLTYVSSTSPLVSTVIVGNRTWTYGYDTSSKPYLTSVKLPDGSAWSFDLGAFRYAPIIASGGDCAYGNLPDITVGSNGASGSITHPSGLTATFNIAPVKHGRSYVDYECYQMGGETRADEWTYPPIYWQQSISSKVFTGAGLPERTWTYSYSGDNHSLKTDACATAGACPATVYTDVINPDGRDVRYTFSNRFDASEGLLVRTDTYTGDKTSAILRSEINSYANPTGGPWPAYYGQDIQSRDNRAQVEEISPLQQRQIVEEGDTYTWAAITFNNYAQVTKADRINSIAGQAGIEESFTYLNDTNLWVLGLPLTVVNNTYGNQVESSNTYNSQDLLASRSVFGELMMSYGYDTEGLLTSFTDGNSHTTTLGGYKRGIPQNIAYPDGSSESLVVDDFGQISSITDQRGATTSYLYDPVGRVTQISYPAGDTVAWVPKTFAYNYVTSAERGVDAGHWRRTAMQGNAVAVTYFDAELRPVLSDTYDSNNGSSHSNVRTDYDWKGQTTFASYPVGGTPDRTGITAGTTTTYDALGRAIQTQSTSELGTLTSSTTYLSGAGRQVTDPRGKVTTSYYQVFDQPSYDAVIEVRAPAGITQEVTRDLYGKPKAIRQYGTGGDVTKTLTYDTYQRLCLTTEPESGSVATAYDGANNVVWTADGLTAVSGCQSDAANKTTRTYDAMNRVLTLVPPSGTQSTSYSYDAQGNLASAVSGISSWTASRNTLGLITTESLALTGQPTRTIGYTYDANASLASIQYPNGAVVNYAPDALGRPTQAGSYASGVSYYPNGEVASFTYGSGLGYAASQNARQQLSNLSYGLTGSLAFSEDLTYDANANITNVHDLTTNGPRTKAFSYDDLNRLSSATATNLWGSESYTYDPLNNLSSLTTNGRTLNYNYASNNVLASITSGGSSVASFAYDNRGNIINENGVVTNFDAKNQMVGVTGGASYAYDAAGRRVSKTIGGASTYYFYTSAGQLLYQHDGGTTKSTNFIYLGKKLIARDESYDSSIVGTIDGLSSDGAWVNGWACSSGVAQSINVDLYIGGPAGSGKGIARYTANASSEAAVAQACGVSSGSYRFNIPLSDALRSQYAGQGIYIHGISPVGNSNLLLTHSGTYLVPALSSAPAAPTSVTASVASDLSSISVSWPSSSSATSYAVQQRINGGAWSQVASSSATSYAVNAPADGSYAFQVQACNTTGCSGWTASSTVTVAHQPVEPASITVPATSTGSVTVTWAAAAYASGYVLQQQIGSGSWSTVYTGASTSSVLTLTTSGTYTYRVQSTNANGSSAFRVSSGVAVTIPPASAPSLSVPNSSATGSYAVSWSSVSGASSYALQEQISSGTWTTVQTTASTSWAASGKGNGKYGYRVQACNAGGCGPWSATGTLTVALIPATPTLAAVTYTGAYYKPVLHVTWSAVSGATSYQLEETTPTEVAQIIYNGTATSWSQLTYANGTVTFRVKACNSVGCSAFSAYQSIDLASGS